MRHLAAWRRLAAVVGMPQARTRLGGRLHDSLPQFEWDASLARLLVRSPEMSAAIARARRRVCARSGPSAEACPNVEVSKSACQHANDSGDNVVNVMAGVPLPLSIATRATFARPKAEVAAAQAGDRTACGLDLQNRLAIAFDAMPMPAEQVRRYQQNILPNAKSVAGAGDVRLSRKGIRLRRGAHRAADVFSDQPGAVPMPSRAARVGRLDRRNAVVRQPVERR